jgi:hypothetical protein
MTRGLNLGYEQKFRRETNRRPEDQKKIFSPDLLASCYFF